MVAMALGQEAPGKQEKAKASSDREILERLEAKLSGVRTVQADFVQVKRLAMFRREMVIRGRLAVQNPQRIAWHVDKPVRYSLVIDGPKLAQWDEDTDRVQIVRLDKNPSFKEAFQQLTAWFSGRYASLRRQYQVSIEQADPYVLVFSPREGSDMVKVIRKVRIVFRKDERYIEELALHEASGNTSVIRFSNTRLNEAVGDDAWKVRPGD
jgi:outer membrane lipoprotein-sorting protein